MKVFHNLKTGTKLYSIVALMAVAMIVVGGIGPFLAKTSNGGLETVSSSCRIWSACSGLPEARGINRRIDLQKTCVGGCHRRHSFV